MLFFDAARPRPPDARSAHSAADASAPA